jgi:hypothetical protein
LPPHSAKLITDGKITLISAPLFSPSMSFRIHR